MSGVMKTVTLKGSVVKSINDKMVDMTNSYNRWLMGMQYCRMPGGLLPDTAMETCRAKAASFALMFGKASDAYRLGIIEITVDAKGELVWKWA